jgi:hypothetical protein
MRHYLIAGGQVTICRKPPTKLAKGDLLVSSSEELEASRLNTKQLVAVYDGLPGAEKLTKVSSRKAALDALWAALERLAATGKAAKKAAASQRPASKQAQVIAMLRRPQGATVDAIIAATGWQRHTVRGVISGALKKKLGLAIVSEKAAGGTRVYRIAQPERARA